MKKRKQKYWKVVVKYCFKRNNQTMTNYFEWNWEERGMKGNYRDIVVQSNRIVLTKKFCTNLVIIVLRYENSSFSLL